MAALALVVGGVPAAPFAAITVRLEPRPLLMTGVGLLIVLLSLHDLWQLNLTSRIRSNRSSAVNRERPLPREPSTAADRPERRKGCHAALKLLSPLASRATTPRYRP